MNPNNDSVTVVVAREGSLGVRNKNLRKIGGLPLVVRAARHAQQVVSKIPIVLSTDSQPAVTAVARDLGVTPPTLQDLEPGGFRFFESVIFHRRPKKLATSTTRISMVLQQLRDSFLGLDLSFARWNLIQPTCPFRSVGDIAKFNDAQSSISKDQSFVSVASVEEIHPARMYLRDSDGFLKNLGVFPQFETANRQDLPKVFIRDGAFYSIGDVLVESAVQVGEKPKFMAREYPWSINIDDLKSLSLARIECRKVESLDASSFR